MATLQSELKDWTSDVNKPSLVFAPLGTADDTIAVNQRIAAADHYGKANNVSLQVSLGGLQYLCDRTVFFDHTANLQLVAGKDGTNVGTFRTTTDTGGLNPQDARRRAHIRMWGCVDTSICGGVRIRGTHPESGPSRSPSITSAQQAAAAAQWGLPLSAVPTRNIWEAQHGVDVASCTRPMFCSLDVSNIWGDAVSCAAAAGVYIPNTSVLIIGLKAHRTGRMAVLAHDCRGFTFQDSDLSMIASSWLHMESQSGEVRTNTNMVMKGIRGDGAGGYAVHISGSTGVDGLWITDIIRSGAAANVYVESSRARTPDGKFGTRNVNVVNTRWDQPQVGGYLWDIRFVEDFTSDLNHGPLRPNRTVGQQIRFMAMNHLTNGAGNQVWGASGCTGYCTLPGITTG